MTTIQWLEFCSNKRVILEDEFRPTGKLHKGCCYTKVMFDGIAYDYMNTDSFERNFGKASFIAIYVNLVCPDCGNVKSDSNDEEIQYLKVVRNTPENRRRFGYVYEEPVNEASKDPEE